MDTPLQQVVQPIIEPASIAVINTNISYIQRDLNEIKQKMENNFATRIALEDVARQTEFRLKKLEDSQGFRRISVPIVTAVASSLILFLLLSYFRHIK